MKRLAIITLALASALTAAFAGPGEFGRDTRVCDPVLIPTGGLSKRPTFNKVNLRPYLTHYYADGHREWFYDSFIFGETNWYDRATNETRVLVNAGKGQLPATKADWIVYLEHLFGEGHDLHALDELITDMKATLGEPQVRHSVILGICHPCKDGRGTPDICEWRKFDWGEIDGVDMDFTNIEHRITVTKWFIDRLLERFEQENFQNFDLAGFYCQDETMYTVGDITPAVNDYIHELGYRSYWIPFWGQLNDEYTMNASKVYHFDMTWRQPNYFFYNKDGSLPPKSQLYTCITQSKLYGVGLELEFETFGKSGGMHESAPEMHQRLIDYIDYFEKYGVWEESGVAHYCGSRGFIDMAASADPVNQATMDRLASIVAKRQKAFAGVEAPALPESKAQFAYPGQGSIFIPADFPDAAVYSTAGLLLHRGSGSFSCAPGVYIASDGAGRTVKVAVK